MPEFANPEFLWLAPVAVLVGAWWVRRRRPALRYADTRLFAGLPSGRARFARWGGAVLRSLALLSLVVACAGPRRPDLRTPLPAEGIAVVLTLDVSQSMADPQNVVPWAPGEPPVTRLEAAKRSFKLFVAGGEAPDGTKFDPRPSDQMGLVTFAQVPQTACPLTLNHSVLVRVAEAQQAHEAGEDTGTNVGDALAWGLARLRAAGNKRKVLILLSDGESTVVLGPDSPGGPNLDPLESARVAAGLGIKVYTIDAGGEGPLGAATDRQRGRETLRAIAELTGGRSFDAHNGTELLAAYKEIDALEKSTTESPIYRRYHEDYVWAAAAAVVLLLVAHLLDRTRWRVVP